MLSQSLSYGLTRYLILGLGLVRTYIVVRLFGPDGYGVIAAILLALEYSISLCGPALNNLLNRIQAKRPRKTRIQARITFLLFSLQFFLMLVSLISLFFYQGVIHGYFYEFAILLGLIIFRSVQIQYLRIKKLIFNISISELVSSASFLGLFLLLSTPESEPNLYLYCNIISIVFAILVSPKPIFEIKIFNWRLVAKCMRFLPFFWLLILVQEILIGDLLRFLAPLFFEDKFIVDMQIITQYSRGFLAGFNVVFFSFGAVLMRHLGHGSLDDSKIKFDNIGERMWTPTLAVYFACISVVIFFISILFSATVSDFSLIPIVCWMLILKLYSNLFLIWSFSRSKFAGFLFAGGVIFVCQVPVAYLYSINIVSDKSLVLLVFLISSSSFLYLANLFERFFVNDFSTCLFGGLSLKLIRFGFWVWLISLAMSVTQDVNWIVFLIIGVLECCISSRNFVVFWRFLLRVVWLYPFLNMEKINAEVRRYVLE